MANTEGGVNLCGTVLMCVPVLNTPLLPSRWRINRDRSIHKIFLSFATLLGVGVLFYSPPFGEYHPHNLVYFI